MNYLYKLTKYILGLGVLFMAVSCLDTPAPDDDIRFELRFQAENLGEAILEPNVAEPDTFIIDEVKFSMDRFIIVDTDSTVLESSSQVPAFILFYDEDQSEENLIFSTILGFRDITRFQSYEIFVQPVPNSTAISDTDFFGDDGNFSFVMNGSVNGIPFAYRSSPSFSKLFEFPVVSIASQNETFLVEKFVSARDLLFDENGEILDPTNSANFPAINSNLEEYLRIEASAANLIN
jgi:hypothetical protein